MWLITLVGFLLASLGAVEIETFIFSQCSCDSQQTIPALSSFDGRQSNFVEGEFSLGDDSRGFKCADIDEQLQLPEYPGVSIETGDVIEGVTISSSFFEKEFAVIWRGDERIENVKKTLSNFTERTLFDIGGEIILKESLKENNELLITISIFNETFEISESTYRRGTRFFETEDVYIIHQSRRIRGQTLEETTPLKFCVSSAKFGSDLSLFSEFNCLTLLEDFKFPSNTSPKKVQLMQSNSTGDDRAMLSFTLASGTFADHSIISRGMSFDFGQFPIPREGLPVVHELVKPPFDVRITEFMSDRDGFPIVYDITANKYEFEVINPTFNVDDLEIRNVRDGDFIEFFPPPEFEEDVELAVTAILPGNCRAKNPVIEKFRVDNVPTLPRFTDSVFEFEVAIEPDFTGELTISFEVPFRDDDFLDGIPSFGHVLIDFNENEANGSLEVRPGFPFDSREITEPSVARFRFGRAGFQYTSNDLVTAENDSVLEEINLFLADDTILLTVKNLEEMADQVAKAKILLINPLNPPESPRPNQPFEDSDSLSSGELVGISFLAIFTFGSIILIFYVSNSMINKSLRKKNQKRKGALKAHQGLEKINQKEEINDLL